MNEDQRDAIRECQPNLEKSMPPDYMKSQLIAGHIISLEDDDEIDAIPTHNKKNAALIKMVLRSSSKDSYDIFVRALKSIPTKSNVLADMVESCYKKKSSAISANIDDSDSCAKNGDQSGIKKKRSDISSDTDSVDVKSDQLDGTTGKDNDLDVFISYSWDNQEEVLLIKNYLEAHKLKVWMDLQHVKGGKLLNEVLADGIQRCKVFVPCISESYIKSGNCYSEISSARDYRRYIIPLILGNLNPRNGDLKSDFGDLNFFITGKTYIKIKDFKDQKDKDSKLNELKNAILSFQAQ